jgi:Ca-activated chloride channel family protein
VNLRFDLPWAAAAAAVLALLSAGTFWLWHRRRMARLAHLGGEAAIERLAPSGVRRAPVTRAFRVSAALGLAVVAFAGPRWGTGTAVVRTEGIDVVLAMDASLSMLAEDERPSRLERMKQEVRRFRALAPGDRVALLAFAGRSYILSPLTTDDGAIDLFLDNFDPSIVGQAGTALAPTIRQGVDLLRAARGGAGRALVILSDGEAWDDRTETLVAARAARDADIAVVTVGFGTEGGATIPLREGNRVTEKLDDAGQVVITRYDPSLLRDIANAAGGEFIPAPETDKGARINQALSRIDAKQRDVAEGLSRPLRTAWFLVPALLLLLADAWIADGGSLARMRRSLRLAAPLLLLAAPGTAAHAQSTIDANELFKAGLFARAAERWKEQIAAGDRRPSTLYNFGTALLAEDSLDAAVDVLERAAQVPDAALRRRALYNLGLAQLRRGMLPGAPDPRAYTSAATAYRTLLRQAPADTDAKWNYELALRLQKQQSGGGGSNDNNSQQQEAQRNPADEGKAMSRQQAEQLLAAAAREEEATEARRQRATTQDRPPGGKSW